MSDYSGHHQRSPADEVLHLAELLNRAVTDARKAGWNVSVSTGMDSQNSGVSVHVSRSISQ